MIRQHHRINTAVALSAIAAALLVAGCGGSSSSGWVAGVNTVRAAYVSSNAAGYQMAIKVTGNAAGHTINVTGTGTFAQAADSGRLTIHVSQPTLGGRNLKIDYVILGKDVYLKLPASLAGKIPGGKSWLQRDLSEIGGAPGSRDCHRWSTTRARTPLASCRSCTPTRPAPSRPSATRRSTESTRPPCERPSTYRRSSTRCPPPSSGAPPRRSRRSRSSAGSATCRSRRGSTPRTTSGGLSCPRRGTSDGSRSPRRSSSTSSSTGPSQCRPLRRRTR